ncbi:uncharacterized protein PFL1_06693 [Pseudozyma flocculosa PF-1]|uniref:EKC/KEOPS complex subunit CGI121 n=2 Tax=Pseudozyma flocculosa TaxID=84751 RepID=A0A5C3F7R6_9BASI|nr:uncharacterized protein PFL1_06693 [Pseudozyma flocculosa PF-1]EPQ25826.1 hypothetical protein PFL1_06693 [Pseudozyma flocculosa PF-1]SPO40473.1 related to Protein CGI121 [Pseudozyma flocculosa]
METISLPPHFPRHLQRVHLAHISPLTPDQSSQILARIIAASKLPTRDDAAPSTREEEVEAAERERARLDYAFIDPTRICGRNHVVTAILQAALVAARAEARNQQPQQPGHQSGGMKTKTVHSEVIWCLSPGNNVGESLKRFGLTPQSTSLLLVRFSDAQLDASTVLDEMLSIVPPSSETGPARLTIPPPPPAAPPATGTTADAGADDAVQDDIDSAIRYGGPSAHARARARAPVTDWQQLNKIYKLSLPAPLLDRIKSSDWSDETRRQLEPYEDICCTSVAMKLVAA